MALTKVTGQVIKNTTDVTVGVLTVTNTLAVGGTVSIGGTLTYEDVTNVDAVGLITARNGIVVGSGITLSVDGDIFATGVCTATTFSGDGSALTGVANTDVIFTDKITLPDSSGSSSTAGGSINVGLGSDLQIFHNGTNSYIKSSTGNLWVGANNYLNFAGGADFGTYTARFLDGGAAELYHNGTKRIETTSGGAAVSTTNDGFAIGQGSHTGGNIRLDLHSATSGVGCLIRFANDHNDDAYIGLAGDTTGDLLIYGGEDKIQIQPQGSAAVELYHGTSKKFETYANGVYAGDGVYIAAGNSQDLSLRHNGTNSIINNTTGNLSICADDLRIRGDGEDEHMAKFVKNGAASLYHDNVEKLATFAQGVDVIVSGNSGLRIRGNVADVDPRLVFRRKNNDGNNSEPAAIVMAYDSGTTHESGHLDFYTNGDSGSAALNRRVRIRNDGQILINTTTLTSLGSQTGANNVVTVNKSGICLTAYSVVAGFYYDRINFTNSQYYVVNSSGTGVYLGNGNTSWTANSDERLKINITELDGIKAYNHVKTARATSFNWNASGHSTDKKIGFIAQDWETNYPEVVNTSTETVDGVENPKGIQYTETVPVLMAALKEAIAKIETLETKVAALEG